MAQTPIVGEVHDIFFHFYPNVEFKRGGSTVLGLRNANVSELASLPCRLGFSKGNIRYSQYIPILVKPPTSHTHTHNTGPNTL